MSNIDPDKPISDITEDKLFREGFVIAIAEELRSLRDGDSKIVGICGEWGQGKTSILNLLRNEIEAKNLLEFRDGKSRLTRRLVDLGLKMPFVRGWIARKWINVVVFSTWHWGSGDQVVRSLLKVLGSQTGLRMFPRIVSRSYQTFMLLGELIAPMQKAHSNIEKPLVFLLTIATSGLVFADSHSYLRDLMWNNGWLLLLVISCISGVFVINRGLAFWNMVANKSIEEVQHDLRKSFRKTKRAIIVFIDDLDRHNNEEIKAVLQLVKTNGAFPNLVYVLAYDRDRVSRAHDDSTGSRGMEYVKKIVNIELDIPVIPDEIIRSLIIEDLDKVLHRAPIVLRGNNKRWDQVLNSTIISFFKSIRDVKRFANSSSFYFGLHTNNGALEVNPIDLFIIETVRMFDLELFKRIKSCRQQLTSLQHSFFVANSRSEFSKILFNELTQSVDEKQREQRSYVVCELFPQLQNQPTDSNQMMWRQDFRVCDLSIFNRYFQIRRTDDTPSARHLSDFLNENTSLVSKSELVSSLISSGGISEFIQTLRSVADEIPFEVIENNCIVLFDCADGMGLAHETYLRRELSSECVGLTYSLLRPFIGVISDRTLMSILNQTQGLVVALRFYSRECESERVRKPDDGFLLLETSIPELKKRCLDLIKHWVDAGKLIDHAELAFVLYRWNELTNNGDVGRWILENAIDDDNAKILLGALTSTAYGSAGNSRILHGTDMDSLVPLESWYEIVKNISDNQLDEDLLNCRNLLEMAVSLKESGKSFEHIENRSY